MLQFLDVKVRAKALLFQLRSADALSACQLAVQLLMFCYDKKAEAP